MLHDTYGLSFQEIEDLTLHQFIFLANALERIHSSHNTKHNNFQGNTSKQVKSKADFAELASKFNGGS